MKPTESAHADSTAFTGAVRGLAAGTSIMTLDGEMPIEFLAAGDRIITRDTGIAKLRKVRTRTVLCDVVRIAGGSLGHNRPDSDVTLPADQEILVRYWRAQAIYGQKHALIPAARLVDGEYVRACGKEVLTVHELIFDTDHIIYAGGLEVAAKSLEQYAAAS